MKKVIWVLILSFVFLSGASGRPTSEIQPETFQATIDVNDLDASLHSIDTDQGSVETWLSGRTTMEISGVIVTLRYAYVDTSFGRNIIITSTPYGQDQFALDAIALVDSNGEALKIDLQQVTPANLWHMGSRDYIAVISTTDLGSAFSSVILSGEVSSYE